MRRMFQSTVLLLLFVTLSLIAQEKPKSENLELVPKRLGHIVGIVPTNDPRMTLSCMGEALWRIENFG